MMSLFCGIERLRIRRPSPGRVPRATHAERVWARHRHNSGAMTDGGEAKPGRKPPTGAPPSRGRLWVRRIVALVATGAATGLIAGLLFGGGSSGGGAELRIPSGVPAAARKAVARM